MKLESKFIAELEAKAKEQQKLAETQLIPNWAKDIGLWLAVNPWRVLVPASAIIYSGIRIFGGIPYREFILGLFGGFAR
jgi:hypothetical protein